MSRLTKRQREAYDAIKRYMAKHDGRAPSLQDLANALRLRSLASVLELLRRLEEKGYIRRRANEARAIAIVDASRPRIVCLCGSTKFWREFQRAGLRETLAGRIVLTIGAAAGTDDEHFGNLPRQEWERVKAQLDELHLRKIDLADEVLVLDVDGYIGKSTRREIAYAEHLGKPVRYLSEERAA